MYRYFEITPLKFECTRCGACCRGQPGAYVFVTEKETQKICLHLGLGIDVFREKFLTNTSEGELSLVLQEDSSCVFLDEQGRCSIYAVRPSQCSTYPFWPELVSSAFSWLEEANRCEGIGRGSAVPSEHISQLLKVAADPDGCL